MTWSRCALHMAAAGLLLGAHGVGEGEAQEKPRVAVIAFENHTQWWSDRLGAAAADVLTTRLVQAGAFSVIERERLAAVMEELGLQQSGAVAESDVQRLGETAGVEYLVVGGISSFSIEETGGAISFISAGVTEAQAAANVRLIQVRTGEIVTAAEGEGTKRLLNVDTSEGGISQTTYDAGLAEQALQPAMDAIVEQLVAEAPNLEVSDDASAPSIVGAGDGGAIYIDWGENRGVSVGDRFEALSVVDEIRDASGRVLDVITDPVGVLEVTRVLSQSSVCALAEGTTEGATMLRPMEQGG